MSEPTTALPDTVALEAPIAARIPVLRRPWLTTLGNAVRLPRTSAGLVLVGFIVAIALLGPLLAPHSPTEFIAAPNSGRSGDALFGADALGRDVWSRFLNGGRTVLWLSAAATVVGIVLGVTVGLVAAYSRNWLDDVLMRANDVVLAFPQIVLVLLAVSAFGPKLWLVALTVGLTHMPQVARVIRGAALEVVEREFVKAAEAIGVPTHRILLQEVLPSVTSTLLVEIGLRMTYSIGLVAAISFLGFGLQPPSADWGLMINESRLAIVVQPWPIVLPVLAIALLTVGTNLITDGVARAAIGIGGRSPR